MALSHAKSHFPPWNEVAQLFKMRRTAGKGFYNQKQPTEWFRCGEGEGILSGDRFAWKFSPVGGLCPVEGLVHEVSQCIRLSHTLPLSGGVPDGILAAVL